MTRFNLRMPEDLYARAKTAADADDRSLNSWLVSLVRQAVDSGETPDRPGGDPASPAPLRGSGHSSRS
ncbi:Arc family DNA-binding protein [Streptomyces sp. NPDC006602]|uniref:Arc family DNA-binding protein n=1 Tax=Streptomyces sp. NPDC006602 TaxID=3364751 RepID=UPI0036B32451